MPFIDAKEVNVRALLSNAQEAYRVPLYQRPYAWNRDQWEDLFDDVVNLSPKDVHFLGSIMVVPEGEHRLGINHFQVVDGQQRLATLLIWLAAVRDLAKEKNNTELANHLTETFLFAKDWQSGKEVKVPKFQLSKLDNSTFLNVLQGGEKDLGHLVFECYNFFRKMTKTEDIWQKLLDNVSIVHINAFNHFNAFRLFETLNDRGLELSAADLIKNFLLMKSADNEMSFEKAIAQWNEMYEKVRELEPVKFIRRYVLSTYKGKVSESRLYEEVRKRLENEKPEGLLSFATNLNVKSSIYKKIHEAGFSSPKVNATLRDLHLVEVAPSYTLLLKVLPYLEETKVTETNLLRILKMIEIFHIRWGVCGQSTAQLDQIYNDICMGLEDKQPEEFADHVRDVLVEEQKGKADDEIFRRNFATRAFKPTDPRTKYILWKLSGPTGETILNIGEIQTEHIMPQTLSPEWISYLMIPGKKEKEIVAIQQENLNRIGNLAIIKGEWNQSMSNRLFDRKKEEYAKSEFIRTKELINRDKWTFDEISKRSDELAKIASDIWQW